jgi:hypothetical protein
MYASYGTEGDECESHTDPIWHMGYITYHFNILLTQPKRGGDVVLPNQVMSLNKGDLMYYPVSHVEHSTTLLEGDVPRILWVYGFCTRQFLYDLKERQDF